MLRYVTLRFASSSACIILIIIIIPLSSSLHRPERCCVVLVHFLTDYVKDKVFSCVFNTRVLQKHGLLFTSHDSQVEVGTAVSGLVPGNLYPLLDRHDSVCFLARGRQRDVWHAEETVTTSWFLPRQQLFWNHSR